MYMCLISLYTLCVQGIPILSPLLFMPSLYSTFYVIFLRLVVFILTVLIHVYIHCLASIPGSHPRAHILHDHWSLTARAIFQWLAGSKVIRWNYCMRGCAQGERAWERG